MSQKQKRKQKLKQQQQQQKSKKNSWIIFLKLDCVFYQFYWPLRQL